MNACARLVVALTVLFAVFMPPAQARAEATPDTPAEAPVTPPSAPAPAPSASAPEPTPTAGDARLAEAKTLFRQGVVLFTAGDIERALDFFQRSREAFPSAKNTVNAAICLDRLGRFDEALELYEDVLTTFSAELDPESRATIAPAMETLRQRVGSLQVSANEDGSVVVDGRARGKLPLSSVIRVLPGKHLVRVLKDGYATGEASVTVEATRTAQVDLVLRPLAAAGLLRVEDPALPASEVFVDRVSVGHSPWEGTLGPGDHVVWTLLGDRGSAPTSVRIIQGQTVLARVRSGELGAPVRVQVTPPSAVVSVDGVALGQGGWDGRLPSGSHRFEAAEAGYFTVAEGAKVPSVGSAPVIVKIALRIDPAHPRWPRAEKGELWAAVYGGYVIAPSLGSDAEAYCPDRCDKNPTGHGFLGGLRVGYRLRWGLSPELGVGTLQISESFARLIDVPYGGSNQYRVHYLLQDELRVAGTLVTAGLNFRWKPIRRLAIVPRLTGGVVFAKASDDIVGQAQTTGAAVGVRRVGADAGKPVSSVAIALIPEIEVSYDIVAGLWAGVSFAAFFVTRDGPLLNNGSLAVPLDNPKGVNPASVGAVPNYDGVSSEKAYGRGRLMFVPQITAGYRF